MRRATILVLALLSLSLVGCTNGKWPHEVRAENELKRMMWEEGWDVHPYGERGGYLVSPSGEVYPMGAYSKRARARTYLRRD